MSWMSENRGWLERARRRWAPRPAVPFTIRVWFSSPIAWSSDGVKLDGLLQRMVVERETDLPADDVFAECPRGLHPEIQIPIADVTIAGLPIACASWGMPPPIACESIRWRRKRARPEVMGGDRLLIAGGPFKSHNIPVQTLVTPWLDFYVVGTPSLVRDLMGDITALGRGYASGLGMVLGVEYMPDRAERALSHRGEPMRALPLGEGCPLLCDPIVDERPTRAPYWLGKGLALCAIPALRLGNQ